MEPNCEARSFSTVAPQALLLMNNTFVPGAVGAVREAACRKEAGDDAAARVAVAWKLAFARPPSSRR
jgi:hypothetical protein